MTQFTAACIAFGAARVAGAQEGRAPEPPAVVRPAPEPPKYTKYIARGVSTTAPYAWGAVGVTSTAKTGEATSVESSLIAGVGLTSRLWLEGSSGAFKLAPALGYHSPQIGLGAMLIDTPRLELNAITRVTFASEEGSPVEQVEPGIISVVHVGDTLRLDASLYVGVNPPAPASPEARARRSVNAEEQPDAARTTIGLRLPASVGFQITEHVHAAFSSGVKVSNLADVPGTTAIPMGLTIGWSDHVTARGQTLGVSPSISFPELITPGAGQVFNPGNAVFGVTVSFSSKL